MPTTEAASALNEQPVRALLQSISDAWTQGDADRYAELFTEDADYVVFDGTHLKGRRAIAECHRPLFSRFLKGSRLVAESTGIRFLSPDIALVHGKGAVLLKRQSQPSRSRVSVQTLIVLRRPEGWRCAAFQNTRYRPFAKTLIGRILTVFGG